MRKIQLREAEATLSSVIDEAKRGEPSIITRHGKPEAVVISFDEWQKLTRPSFAEFLLSAPIEPGDIPERNKTPMRLPDWAK